MWVDFFNRCACDGVGRLYLLPVVGPAQEVRPRFRKHLNRTLAMGDKKGLEPFVEFLSP